MLLYLVKYRCSDLYLGPVPIDLHKHISVPQGRSFHDIYLVSCRFHLVDILQQLAVHLASAPLVRQSAVVLACLPAMAHLVPPVHTKPVSNLQLLKSMINIVISNVEIRNVPYTTISHLIMTSSLNSFIRITINIY